MGLTGASLVSRALSGLLFGIEARGPVTYAVTALSVAAITGAGCIVPAWRGSGANAVEILRRR